MRHLHVQPREFDRMSVVEANALDRELARVLKDEADERLEHTKLIAAAMGAKVR